MGETDIELATRGETKSELGSDEEASDQTSLVAGRKAMSSEGGGTIAGDDDGLHHEEDNPMSDDGRGDGGCEETARGLAAEFAVGQGIASSWREEEESEGSLNCTDCNDENWLDGEDPCMRAFHCVSYRICRCLGARKLGHLAVLATRTRDDGATELRCVAGPFWPFALCITAPLIVTIETFVALYLLPDHSWWIRVVWAVCMLGMVCGLLGTSCRDPGVLRRTLEKPENDPEGGGTWRWSDQANTYRPPGAQYDSDCGVVIEGFDHVCPWTGTGIGAANLGAFHTFVSCLCVCLILDVLLLVGALDSLR